MGNRWSNMHLHNSIRGLCEKKIVSLDDMAFDLTSMKLFCTKLLLRQELKDHFYGSFKFMYVLVKIMQVYVLMVILALEYNVRGLIR